jgi:hypothetical protein
MEPIDQVKWDLVLTGTSVAESLLALCVIAARRRFLTDAGFYD